MDVKQDSFVIAINGASGSGKSTLVKALVQELGDAVSMFFDDYDPRIVPSSKYPTDITQWINDGANPNEWETPQLIDDLQLLRQGDIVTNPKTKEVLQPSSFIVLEEPFGRERVGMRDLIDFVVAIDVPLEIALARRLLEIPEIPYFVEHPEESLPAILRYLHSYLYHSSRDLYITVNQQVSKNCDLIVDGTKSIDVLATEIAEQVQIAVSVMKGRS
jgi:uridine kinase